MLESIPHACAVQSAAQVVENVALAQDTYRLRIRSPEIAERILPGQFLMLRLPNRSDPLLGRPFALYDIYRSPTGDVEGLDVVYLVIGKVTGLMAELTAGDEVTIWGPLGNGFTETPECQELLMVAGGIGQTPFLALARERLGLETYGFENRVIRKPPNVHLFYGARNADLIACAEDFEAAGVQVHLSTDDGSKGHHGFVTGMFEQFVTGQAPINSRYVVGCGPEPMMEGLTKICERHELACQLSLENYMACGIGACFSCVTPVVDESTPEGKDYRRVCVEGPVFEANKLAW